MKTRTTQIAFWSAILLMSLGLAGCGRSQADRRADSHDPGETHALAGDAATQPTGEEKSVSQSDHSRSTESKPAQKSTSASSGSREKAQSGPATGSAEQDIAALLREIQGSGATMSESTTALGPASESINNGLISGAGGASIGAAPHARLGGGGNGAAAPREPRPTRTPRMAAAAPPAAATSPSENASMRTMTAASEPGEAAAPPEPAPSLAPRMAMAASEPAEAAAPESEPTPTASPVAATPAASQPPKDYKLVKVFYGTDRQARAGVEANPLGRIPWNTLTMAAGGATALLALVLCFARRSVALRWVTAVSLLATIGLGVCMVQITRNTKPQEADTSLVYGNGRGTLEMGFCEVSIPKDHEVGELESPSIFRLEINEDPEKHVVLMNVRRQEPNEFYAELNQRIAQSDRKEAFVFVHGYNVTFENAARRTAQLAHDLHFDGAPIFYSWPSQGGLLQYTVDEENVVWTVPHLRDFLLAVAKNTNAQRIHLIAHSMGNRALTAALSRLATESKDGQTRLFHEVLLTAPDIDAEIFRRDIAPAIVNTARRVTLYASSHDAALEASRKVHGYPRAGESGENIIVIPGIDTIDVSAVDTSLMGHSYYGDSDTVLVDMAQLLQEEKPPDLRARLRATTLGALRYWVFLAERIGRRPGQPTP